MTKRALARRVAVAPRRLAAAGVTRARTARWPARSRLFAVGDGGGWSVDEDARHVEQAARRLGFTVAPAAWALHARHQSVFLTSQFTALRSPWPESSHTLGLAYYHGRPGTPGHPEFDRYFGLLREHRQRFDAVQVTHDEMRELVCEAGVDPARVFVVPIGIDLERFPLGDASLKRAARQRFGLPDSAFVVGSFQKDGVGWGEGLEPKLVKGPDLLVEALAHLHSRVPELVALLLGPARGYALQGLEAAGVRYRHAIASSSRELVSAYHALDAYVVTSRQEGGPKGALEALATGASLVSTRVGQVADIVEPERNGLLVDFECAEAVVDALARLAGDADLRASLRAAGRSTAVAFDLPRMDDRWSALLEQLLDRRLP